MPPDIFNSTRTSLLSRGQIFPKPPFFSRPYQKPPQSFSPKYYQPPAATFVAASTSDSGIKELERAFGDPEAALNGTLGKEKPDENQDELPQIDDNNKI